MPICLRIRSSALLKVVEIILGKTLFFAEERRT